MCAQCGKLASCPSERVLSWIRSLRHDARPPWPCNNGEPDFHLGHQRHLRHPLIFLQCGVSKTMGILLEMRTGVAKSRSLFCCSNGLAYSCCQRGQREERFESLICIEKCAL